MENNIIVKNTLAFLFPEDAPQPTLEDMGRFIKTVKGDRSMMDTGYKISDEKSVFIRFKSEEAMSFSFENNPAILPFRYTDGRQVMVKMSVAGGNTRYVRVYDLPPEATNNDLSAVLANYGPIKRIVRERFPAEIGLDMYSGVRGLYMDIQRDIPEVLHFRGRKGRISYDGVKQKCYVCKSNEHLKKACPIFEARRIEQSNQQQEQQQHEQSGIQILPSSMEVKTGEAAAPDSVKTATSKQQSKTITNSQSKGMKKTCPQPDGDACKGCMDTAPDGLNSTKADDSGSESDIEPIDWMASSPEKQQKWIEKNNRRCRRIDRKVALILGRPAL